MSSSGVSRCYLVDLRCLPCGRLLGTLEAAAWPWHGAALVRHANGSSPTIVADWSRLRCEVCGGNIYPDAVNTTRVYAPVSGDDFEQPRRGRPPAWLVAHRQALRAKESEDSPPSAS